MTKIRDLVRSDHRFTIMEMINNWIQVFKWFIQF